MAPASATATAIPPEPAILVAGSGGGAFRSGRYVTTNAEPVTNLFLTMADAMGTRASHSMEIPPDAPAS